MRAGLVYAWTPEGLAPPYINMTLLESGEMVVTVRSHPINGATGVVSQITLPHHETQNMTRMLSLTVGVKR